MPCMELLMPGRWTDDVGRWHGSKATQYAEAYVSPVLTGLSIRLCFCLSKQFEVAIGLGQYVARRDVNQSQSLLYLVFILD